MRPVSFLRRNAAPVMGAGMVVLGLGTGAYADDPAPGTVTLTTVVAIATLVTAVATLGGTALISAMGLGGGFRIAKKGYKWVMSYIG